MSPHSAAVSPTQTISQSPDGGFLGILVVCDLFFNSRKPKSTLEISGGGCGSANTAQPRGCPNPPPRFSAPSPCRRSLWVKNTQRQRWAPGGRNQVSRGRRPQAWPRGPSPRSPGPPPAGRRRPPARRGGGLATAAHERSPRWHSSPCAVYVT